MAENQKLPASECLGWEGEKLVIYFSRLYAFPLFEKVTFLVKDCKEAGVTNEQSCLPVSADKTALGLLQLLLRILPSSYRMKLSSFWASLPEAAQNCRQQ